MGAVLLPVNVGAQSGDDPTTEEIKPYRRKNKQSYTAGDGNTYKYIFDGHKLSDVVVKPYVGTGDDGYTKTPFRSISVSKDPAYDDQVVFLYNPYTRKFLYVDSRWGTQASVRYESFGLPINIVDPDGNDSPVKKYYSYDFNGEKRIGIGFYSESIAMGHYIGCENAPISISGAGMNVVDDGEKRSYKIQFYSDRGGNHPGYDNQGQLKDKSYDEKLSARAILTAKDGGGYWSCDAEREAVFNWVLEPVPADEVGGDANLNVYRLCIYKWNDKIPNDGWTGEEDATWRTPYKSYVKVLPYHWSNEFVDTYGISFDENRSNETAGTYNITGDENPPTGDVAYYWQIVTRKDLKQKFMLDYSDPFNIPEEATGNFTFNIANPDFSRPMYKTINKDGEIAEEPGVKYTTYWSASDPKVQQYLDNTFGASFSNTKYGRYSFLHATADGNISQKFKPYQYGLFRLDVQGFTTGNAGAEMTLSTTKEGSKIMIGDGGRAELEHTALDQIYNPFTRQNLLDEIYDLAKNDGDYTGGDNYREIFRNNKYSEDSKADKAEDWEVWNDNGWKPQIVFDNKVLAHIGKHGEGELGDKDRPVEILGKADASGARPVGVYVVGTDRNFTTDYPYQKNGTGWGPTGQTITANVGDVIKFGPNPTDENKVEKSDDWWMPNGKHSYDREAEITVGEDGYGAGDYIFTRQYNDGSYAVCYYTIKIEGQPEPTHVDVNGTGKPYAFGDNGVDITLAQADGQGTETGDWQVTNDNGWKPQTVKTGVATYISGYNQPAANGENVGNNNRPCQIKGYDEFGRRSLGVYLVGDQVIEAADDTYHSQFPGGDGWNDGKKVITVNPGDNITLGPTADRDNNGLDWWMPYGHEYKRQIDITADYTNAGNYILTQRDEVDGKTVYKVWHYIIKVNGAPDAIVDVDVNGTGKPYALGKNARDVSIAQVKPDPYSNAGFESFDDFKTFLALSSKVLPERVVGRYFYNNMDEFKKSITFYVPESGGHSTQLEDLEIKFNFTGVGDDFANNFIAIDNVRLTYIGDTPFILDETTNETTSSTDADREWVPVYMQRKFDKDAWNAFVCPIPLNVIQLKTAFGEGVEVSEISKKGLDPKYPLRIVFDKVNIPALPDEDAPGYNDIARTRVIWPGHFYIIKPSVEPAYDPDLYKVTTNEITGNISFGKTAEGVYVNLGNHNLSNKKHDYYYDGEDEPIAFPSERLEGVHLGAKQGDAGTAAGDPIILTKYESKTDDTGDVPYLWKFYTERYDEAEQEVEHNQIRLIGSYLPQNIVTGSNYIFATKEGETRLVHLKEDGSHVTKLNGFRFYIHDFSAENGAKSFTFIADGVEDEEEATEIINALIDDDVDGDIYNIAGQKVTGKLPKGA